MILSIHIYLFSNPTGNTYVNPVPTTVTTTGQNYTINTGTTNINSGAARTGVITNAYPNSTANFGVVGSNNNVRIGSGAGNTYVNNTNAYN
jgi:hypothetical protein